MYEIISTNERESLSDNFHIKLPKNILGIANLKYKIKFTKDVNIHESWAQQIKGSDKRTLTTHLIFNNSPVS